MTASRLRGWLGAVVLEFDKRWLLAAASLLVSSNMIINVPVIERFLSVDQHLVPATQRLIYGYNILSVFIALAFGLAIATLRDFVVPVRLAHVLAGMVAVELGVRAVVFSDIVGVGALKNPRLYATGYCGDEGYFVLQHYYNRDVPPRLPVDPELGWTLGTGELDIVTDTHLTLEDVGDRPILFFGDSYVAWGAPMHNKIPQLMDERLPGTDVLNFGVPGYGVDQIALRVRRESPKFRSRRPITLVGIMLHDLDRSLLRYRGGQKPYYELVDETLVLRAPRYSTNREFFERYHFHTKSFMLSLFATPLSKLLRSENWCSEQRFALNRRILQDLSAWTSAHGVDAHYVLFYSHNDLTHVSQREREVRRILTELQVSIIDTREFLEPYVAQRRQVDLYDDGGAGHHSTEANRAIAVGIVEHLGSLDAL